MGRADQRSLCKLLLLLNHPKTFARSFQLSIHTHTLPIYILLHPSRQLAVNSPLSHGSLGSFNFFKTERKRETRQERNRFDKKRKKKQKLRDRTTQENNTKMKN